MKNLSVIIEIKKGEARVIHKDKGVEVTIKGKQTIGADESIAEDAT